MNSIIDVASYIMWRKENLNDRDIQRLCFYSQAAFLVQTGKPLFREDFVAWKTGPVCLELRSFLSNNEEASNGASFSFEEQACPIWQALFLRVVPEVPFGNAGHFPRLEHRQQKEAVCHQQEVHPQTVHGNQQKKESGFLIFVIQKITILQGAGAPNPVPFFCWFFCCFLFAHPDFAKIEV